MNLWRLFRTWISTLRSSRETRYQVGQSWTYEGASTPTSRVIVGAIDREPFGWIVSVSITGVPLPDPATGEVRLQDIDHAPVAGAALDRSTLSLKGEDHPAAGFEEGYENWRRLLAEGEGGFFTITIAEIIGVYRRGLGLRAGSSRFDQSSPAN